MHARVGGRQRDGDDEVSQREPEEAEHEELAAPARQQPLEHGDRALPVRALGGDSAIDRECAEQGEQDKDQGRQRAEQARGEERDAWLVAEGGEVVDPGQAHDPPPRLRLIGEVTVGGRGLRDVQFETHGVHERARWWGFGWA
jgi:hypothetical protein